MLSYSNCAFEQRVLTQRLAAHGLSKDAVGRIRDIYREIHASTAFPVESMTLKDVARCCKFQARHDMTGFEAAVLYGSGKLNKKTKKMLLTYNEDDVLALKHVVLYIESRSDVGGTAKAHLD